MSDFQSRRLDAEDKIFTGILLAWTDCLGKLDSSLETAIYEETYRNCNSERERRIVDAGYLVSEYESWSTPTP